MAGNIIPIKINLTSSAYYTLWAQRWRENEEEWEGFLGAGDKIFAFKEVPSLATFVLSDEKNDLTSHPAWKSLLKNKPIDFTPQPENEYDLIGVLEQFVHDPNPESVAEVEKVFDLTSTIGEVCELNQTTKLFNGHILLGAVTSTNDGIYSKQGKKTWQKIAKIINKNWPNVIDEIDAIVETPPVDEAKLAKIETSYTKELAKINKSKSSEVKDVPPTEELVPDTGSSSAPAPADLFDYSTEIDEESAWYQAGIDPIRITLGDSAYYTLRCYMDDKPLFLGSKKQIYVFNTPQKLLDFIAEDTKTELAKLDTYPLLQTATEAKLAVDILPENDYQLNGIDSDIEAGMLRLDKKQIVLAQELITDAATYCGHEELLTSISSSTSLGWLLNSVISPGAQKLKPQPPFDSEAEAWRVVLYDFSTLLVENP